MNVHVVARVSLQITLNAHSSKIPPWLLVGLALKGEDFQKVAAGALWQPMDNHGTASCNLSLSNCIFAVSPLAGTAGNKGILQGRWQGCCRAAQERLAKVYDNGGQM